MAKVSLRAYNHEIEAMIDRTHLDEAVAHCRHILKTFPKHLETYRLLGKAYLEYKRYTDAADIFSRVLVAVPNDFVSHVGMSIVRDEENKLDDAIWHMERAFETQPSNAAIQSELQRLYGRREGVQPPRIRMTRGALAHMYVQGELYPQAISEIKSVLKDDPGRNDMQVLLARAYYRSGLKNDAADIASAVLRSNPYCLDANRVLVEILGVDHPESVQAYRQRVVELDPYAAQVAGSIFLSNEVPDAAVGLERLDWNGQPVGMQPDWETTQAISLESGKRSDEQPDWLRNTYSESPPPPAGQPTAVPTFDAAPPSAKPTEPVEDIPDFLREAGWAQSTGAFDESKSAFADNEPASTEPPIEQGDLPDWVKAMAPQQPAETPAKEEELPDWINKIGTSALPVSPEAGDQPDWMNELSQPPAQPTDDQPDWLKQLSESEQPAPSASEEQPDWLKGFENETESTPSAAPSGELDWLSQLSEQPETKLPESSSSEFDFLDQPVEPLDVASTTPASNDVGFLDELKSEPETASALPSTHDFDFLNELAEETEQLAPSSAPELSETDNLGKSEQERDDSFAWLENLAAKQGATEGLLTKPEDRLEEEPDWVKQAKEMDVIQPPTPTDQPPVARPAGDLEELGKSEQERDDSFAWLESLAAKQGASEGLLTTPEERLEEEPDWVKQAKSLSGQSQEIPSAQIPEGEEPPVAEPSANLEELGKSEQERDDSFAWLENLAAKQGATEGLLTTPEERLEEEPEWVKQAKDLDAEQPPIATPIPEQPAVMDDTAAWLQSLEEEDAIPLTPASTNDDTAMWLKSLDEPEEVLPQPSQAAPPEDLPAWMQNIEEEKSAEESVQAAPEASREAAEESEWMGSIEEEPVAPVAPRVDTGSLPSWLRGLDKEEAEAQESIFASQEDLPAWLRDETGEIVAEPTKIEPTQAMDWQPVEAKQPEPVTPQAEVEPPQIEAIDLVALIEEKLGAPAQEPEKPAIAPVKHPKEPAKPKGTGKLKMPLEPILGQARNEISRSNISGALETYDRLIRKGRLLEDVIYDLREALYRFPVDVSIWQSLGDAYMRANRLQDALDAYTKAEELLR